MLSESNYVPNLDHFLSWQRIFAIGNWCISVIVFWMLKTYVDQLADTIREEIGKGRWAGDMPGHKNLASELGANSRTVARALEQLEKEGLVQSQGPGRRRKIVPTKARVAVREVKMILYERGDASDSAIRELRRRLENAGYPFSFAPKSLNELKQDPLRVAKMVEMHPTALWIVLAGSRSVLEWFSDAKISALALFGRVGGLSMPGAGIDSFVALQEGLDCIFRLGHKKIVMLTRKERRIPELGRHEQLFLEELKRQGFSSSAYNLPDWEESAEGLRRCLDRLFAFTPPTALFIQDAQLFLAVSRYFSAKRGKDFRQVALIAMDYDPRFEWCDPPVAHFRWDEQAVVRRVVRWVDRVAQGKEDRREFVTPTKFVGGETLPKA